MERERRKAEGKGEEGKREWKLGAIGRGEWGGGVDRARVGKRTKGRKGERRGNGTEFGGFRRWL